MADTVIGAPTSTKGGGNLPPPIMEQKTKQSGDDVKGISSKTPTSNEKTGDSIAASGGSNEQTKSDSERTEEQKTFKLVVRGKEVEVDADNYHRLAQKGLASDSILSEYAETKQALTSIVSAIKNTTSVWDIIKQAGHDPLQLAIDYVHEHGVRRGSLTPEQRELEDLRRERETRIAEQKAREEEESRTAEEKEVSNYRAGYEQSIIQAMESAPDIPRNEHTVQVFAEFMLEAKRRALEVGDTRPVAASMFVDKVRSYYDKLTREFHRRKVDHAKSDEEILGLIDEPIRDRLRKAELARVGSGQRPKPKTSAENGSYPINSDKKRSLSKEEWEASLAQKARE